MDCWVCEGGALWGCSAEVIDWNTWAGVADVPFFNEHNETSQHEQNVRMQSIPIEHHLYKHKYDRINFVSGGLLVDPICGRRSHGHHS